jgi:hypothetical protein
MKKSIVYWRILMGVFPLLFLGLGCDSLSDEPEPFLQVSKTDVLFTAGEDEVKISLNTNCSEWTARVDTDGEDWCSVEEDEESFIISVSKNETFAERSTTVIVEGKGAKTERISVTQEGKSASLEIEGESVVNIPLIGGTATVHIRTNLLTDEWDFEVNDKTALLDGWCQIKKGDAQLDITVKPNPGVNARSIAITFTSKWVEGETDRVVTLTQFGKNPDLRIEAGSGVKAFENTGGQVDVNVITNIPTDEWNFELSSEDASEWCHVTKGTDDKLTIKVDANTEPSVRSVEITVTSDGIDATKYPKIAVMQAAAVPVQYLLLAEGSTWHFQAAAGSETVNIVALNLRWSCALSNPSDASWCDVTQISNSQLRIQVTENTGTSARTADIILTSEAPAQQVKITVMQAAVSSQQPQQPGDGETVKTNFSITGYENQTITVTFVEEDATESLTLDASGNGELSTTHTQAGTIKSIKATGGSEILIGRKEAAGDIKLTVNNHVVQWRTKAGEATTALIGTAAELLLKFNAPSSVTTYDFEADIDLMDQPWTPVTSTFSKTIDGKNHKIYSLNVDFGSIAGSRG